MANAYVISDGNTASTDYFLIPYLESLGYRTQLVDSRQHCSILATCQQDSLIVISRYFPVAFRQQLEECKKVGVSVVYFMDDDLFDSHVLTDLPLRYRWKILRFAKWQQRRLLSLCDEFWVSTPYLLQKYAELTPRLIQPLPSPSLIHSNPSLVKVSYHGTASHRSELLWLSEVIRQVQSSTSYIHFEVFGDSTVKRLYQGIPRVTIVHAMSWNQYLAWSGTVQRDIALAPLLPSAFNSARGPTKFFDYARMGAAGIYSSVAPYKGFIRDGVDGLLLDNDPECWTKTILKLAGDKTTRSRLAASARKRTLAMATPEDGQAFLVSS